MTAAIIQALRNPLLAAAAYNSQKYLFSFYVVYKRLCDAKIVNSRYSALWIDRGCMCQPL